MDDHGTPALASLEEECAADRTAPRVSLDDIKANIGLVSYTSGLTIIAGAGWVTEDPDFVAKESEASLGSLTVCLIVMRNGFTVIGKSAPASPANFDAALGRRLAYDDAIRQIWPLMGFELRQRLMNRDLG